MKFMTDNWFLCVLAALAFYLWHRSRSATARGGDIVAGSYGSGADASGKTPPYAAKPGTHWERAPHLMLDDSGRDYDWTLVSDTLTAGMALQELGLF
jgi:hypothetical protein